MHLVKGDDPVLVADAVHDLVAALVGDGDPSLMVEELDASTYEDDRGDYAIGPLVDAAQTPPFLTERRVVVARHTSVFSTADAVAPLVAYLSDPLPTTALVLVWEKGPRSGARTAAVPKKLADAVTAAGGVVVDTKAGTGRQRTAWLDEQLAAAPVKLDASAKAALAEHLGEDVSRLRGLVETFTSTFGAGARLGADDIEPYLGDAGDVAPWDLTDAIDRGDPRAALDVLERMLGAGRHPLQITASLHGHYGRMLRLDGSGAGNEAQAAEVLGITKGSTFPARKALDQVRVLGSERIQDFVGLLAQTDLELRGARAWPLGAGGRGAGGPAGEPDPDGLGPRRWSPALRIRRSEDQARDQASAWSLARCLTSRDLRRAAWFLWMTPLLAALSSRLMARRVSSSTFSSPCSAAAVTTLVRVFSSERTALLRRRRFSFCLLRLIWLLMLATKVPGSRDGGHDRPGGHSATAGRG